MKITDVEINNFKALKNVSFRLDDKQSIFVGRNNSGKTSAMELFDKFINRKNNIFSWNDFSIIYVNEFIESIKENKKSSSLKSDEDKYKETQLTHPPKISLKLKIEYESDENITNLSPFIMDLDSNKQHVHIIFEFSHNNIKKLLESMKSINDKNEIITYLIKNYIKECSIKVFPYHDEESIIGEEVTTTEVSNLFILEIIGANRAIEDEENRKKGRLALGFEQLYGVVDNEIDNKTTGLQESLDKFSDTFNMELLKIMEPYLKKIENIGYINQPKLKIKLELTALNFLRSSMGIWFSDVENTEIEYELPESHSGLGYKNLFYILVKIFYFVEKCRAIDIPNIKLLVIEEPECHIHPQIQISFIKKCEETIKKELNAENMFQMIITTHSSHIVSNAEFPQLLYFIAGNFMSGVKCLRDSGDDEENIQFIKRYMGVSNCDIFFADKIIIVEGISEELVLKQKIKDLEIAQHISFINANGVDNINKFLNLIEFIEIKTLIITDLDIVNKESTNSVIKKWFKNDCEVNKILRKTPKEKTKNKIRLVYQMPEMESGGKYGDNFEEACILKNPVLLFEYIKEKSNYPQGYNFDSIVGQDDIVNGFYIDNKTSNWKAIAGSMNSNYKMKFAWYIISKIEYWVEPIYIAEGINWLKEK